MSNTIMLIGSVCLTDLLEQAKNGHSAFYRGTNKKVYANIVQFISDEPNEYGQHAQILLSEKPAEKHKKSYIANLKKFERKEPEPLTAETMDIEIAQFQDDDLPF